MKIFGITVVKNEADIIEYSLAEASKWATSIFVLDNGSTDGTWEKIKELSKSNKVIVPWKQLVQPFSDTLRALVFNEFRHLASEDDWWCMRLDADEFYIDDPRLFLKERVEPYYNLVCSRHIQYVLTEEDVKSIPFTLPVPDIISRLRYVSPFATSEARFFRHRKRLRWLPEHVLPRHVGMVTPERILLRHYQFRSPDQVYNRLLTRIEARGHNSHVFVHVKSPDIADYIGKAKDCIQDNGDIALYNNLPLANNLDLTYPWWKLILYRLLQTTRLHP